MNKFYSLLVIGGFLATSQAQVKVTFQVDMKNETASPNGVTVPGTWQDDAGGAEEWKPGNPEALLVKGTGTVWSKQVTLPSNSTFQYKFVNNNDWVSGIESVPNDCRAAGTDNRFITTGTTDTVINLVCFSSCAICPAVVYKRNVTFTITDLNYTNPTFKFTDVKLKGAFSGWADFVAYDDATNGDATANDGIWTAKYEVKEGDYEWGGTNRGNWFIAGSNRRLKMGPTGLAQGDSTYTISALGSLINVTFRVDLRDTLPDAAGVFVTGNFMDKLEFPIGNWDKDTLKLTKLGATNVYTFTTKMYAENYQYKFYNGIDPSSEIKGENLINVNCGELNGFGQYNRSLTLRGRTKDSILPIYLWNRCLKSPAANKSINPSEISIVPNPASTQFVVNLQNSTVQSVNVFSLDGRNVLTSTSNIVSVKTLTTGVYLVRVMDNFGRVANQKVAIK